MDGFEKSNHQYYMNLPFMLFGAVAWSALFASDSSLVGFRFETKGVEGEGAISNNAIIDSSIAASVDKFTKNCKLFGVVFLQHLALRKAYR